MTLGVEMKNRKTLKFLRIEIIAAALKITQCVSGEACAPVWE